MLPHHLSSTSTMPFDRHAHPCGHSQYQGPHGAPYYRYYATEEMIQSLEQVSPTTGSNAVAEDQARAEPTTSYGSMDIQSGQKRRRVEGRMRFLLTSDVYRGRVETIKRGRRALTRAYVLAMRTQPPPPPPLPEAREPKAPEPEAPAQAPQPTAPPMRSSRRAARERARQRQKVGHAEGEPSAALDAAAMTLSSAVAAAAAPPRVNALSDLFIAPPHSISAWSGWQRLRRPGRRRISDEVVARGETASVRSTPVRSSHPLSPNEILGSLTTLDVDGHTSNGVEPSAIGRHSHHGERQFFINVERLEGSNHSAHGGKRFQIDVEERRRDSRAFGARYRLPLWRSREQ